MAQTPDMRRGASVPGKEEDARSQKSSESQPTRHSSSRRKPPTSFKSQLYEDELVKLFEFFALSGKKQRADKMLEVYQKQCLILLVKDYEVALFKNGQDVCPTYPLDILLPYKSKYSCGVFKDCSAKLIQTLTDEVTLRNQIVGSRHARCRDRFVVPAFFFNGKAVCRSATLSSFFEAVGRQFVGSLTGDLSTSAAAATTSVQQTAEYEKLSPDQQFRIVDVELLKSLEIDHIFDLMVECKKVKYGMYWSSSEKVDEFGQYGDIPVTQLPYPGCEYFREVAVNNHNAAGMVFKWDQPFINSRVNILTDSSLGIEWDDYKTWDLITLTQNYVLAMLEYLRNDNTGGLLVHCISGWDRTPLFVSLLRITLWADGLLHQSLDPVEMLFFTVAYDWLLFGHQLSTRLQTGELIFFFCFNFLNHLESDKFSMRKLAPAPSSSSCARTESNSSVDSGVQAMSPTSISPELVFNRTASEGADLPQSTRVGLAQGSDGSFSDPSDAACNVDDSAAVSVGGPHRLSSSQGSEGSPAKECTDPVTPGPAADDLDGWTYLERRVTVIPGTRQEKLSKLRESFLSAYEVAAAQGAFATAGWSQAFFSNALTSLKSFVSGPGHSTSAQ